MARSRFLLPSFSNFLLAVVFSLISFSSAFAESETAPALWSRSGPEIIASKLPLAEIGLFYSTQLRAVDDWAVVSWSIEQPLPPGLKFDPETGVLSGTPEIYGRYEITVVLTDHRGETAEKLFELYVLNVVKDLNSLPKASAPSTQLDSRQALSAAGVVQQAGHGPDLTELLDILEATADGNWVQVNTNFYEDVWAPSELQPLKGRGSSSPRKIIGAWSSFAWDSNRGDLLLYGGGHANSSGNDVYRWRGTTRQWERASLPSEVVQIADPKEVFTAVDGAYAAPGSSHTYDNNIFLPIADRFLTFGGAGYDHGGPYKRATATAPVTTGPYLFNPALADPKALSTAPPDMQRKMARMSSM